MDHMSNPIRIITIVGGGTAGWITAGVIAAAHDSEKGRVKVRLIEAPDIPTIGVGEGTWPTLRTTLRAMGIKERDFIRACDASFKQGSKFCGWVNGTDNDCYYHPFELPLAFFDTNPVTAWLQSDGDQSFSKSVCPQEYICEAHLAPKMPTTPDFAGISNYGYHLDAGKFSEFIKRHCIEELGVEFISDKVVEVISEENGDIQGVRTKHHGVVEGDLFIDCSGFRSLLLGGHYRVPPKPLKDVLFVDSALAVQLPYAENEPIQSQTLSTAQTAGWIWDIGLSTRRGVGHVFSSSHTSDQSALEELRKYLAMDEGQFADLSVRKLSIEASYRSELWKHNCVAVGLSAGFLEPLEASAIVMIEKSAKMIAAQLPTSRDAMDVVSKRFNTSFTHHWERIVDFLKLHYVLSRRTGDFWIDNRAQETLSDRLREDMSLWQHQAPWAEDFEHKDEIFPAASYQYVLYGMGFQTQPSPLGLTTKEKQLVSERRQKIDRLVTSGLKQLESNRAALERIRGPVNAPTLMPEGRPR